MTGSAADAINAICFAGGSLYGLEASTGVAAELFKNLTGTNIVHVPYGGGGPALVAILNGEAGVSFLSMVATTGYIANGRMRALGVTSARRSKVMPNLT